MDLIKITDYVISCDTPGCVAESSTLDHSSTGEEPTSHLFAVALFKELGWSIRGVPGSLRTRCPRCSRGEGPQTQPGLI